MYMRLRELESERTEMLVLQRSKELRDNPVIAVPWRDIRLWEIKKSRQSINVMNACCEFKHLLLFHFLIA
jgi:hypothetical protein